MNLEVISIILNIHQKSACLLMLEVKNVLMSISAELFSFHWHFIYK